MKEAGKWVEDMDARIGKLWAENFASWKSKNEVMLETKALNEFLDVAMVAGNTGDMTNCKWLEIRDDPQAEEVMQKYEYILLNTSTVERVSLALANLLSAHPAEQIICQNIHAAARQCGEARLQMKTVFHTIILADVMLDKERKDDWAKDFDNVEKIFLDAKCDPEMLPTYFRQLYLDIRGSKKTPSAANPTVGISKRDDWCAVVSGMTVGNSK